MTCSYVTDNMPASKQTDSTHVHLKLQIDVPSVLCTPRSISDLKDNLMVPHLHSELQYTAASVGGKTVSEPYSGDTSDTYNSFSTLFH